MAHTDTVRQHYHAQSPFELGWPSGKWTRATATIVDTTVELAISSAEVTVDESGFTSSTGPTEVRYAWEGYPQCALYSGTGGFASKHALPAAPFRVALGPCGPGQSRCELGNVTIGAFKAAAQCCSTRESCVPFGGCQAAIPKHRADGGN